MKYMSALLTFVVVVCVVRVDGQNPPKPQSEKPEDVVTVTTNLVQVDAVVTDKDGRHITDLQPEDFELVENGKVRPVSAFSYIPLTSKQSSLAPASAGPAAVTGLKNMGPPTNLHAIRPESVRRAIAIVVDDFGLSFESIARLRSALEKFVQEDTLPTDLIGIIRTSGGPGSMQQFTSNRAQLLAIVKQIRWYQTGRGAMSSTDSISPINSDELGLELRGYSTNQKIDASNKEFFGGSLGALGFVIHGLSRFPGRKSIVLISDNLPATSREALISRGLDKLIERANQFSIVVSTIDARGMEKPGLTADDSQYNLAANQIVSRMRTRRIRFGIEQDALNYLAMQTGGVFVHDNNDLKDGLRRIIDGEQGYYLLAYRPDDADELKSRGRSYKVSLRLKRPGLQIRSRTSFHRTLPREAVPQPVAKDDSLRAALSSPFVKEDVRVKMTALFTGGTEVKILVHVEAKDMEITKAADDSYTGSFDFAAVAFDNNGKVASQAARNQTLRVTSRNYDGFLRDGFAYAVSLPVEAPGPYQFRVALRDAASGRLGSDSQFVEVPDPKKAQLAVSGFMVQPSVVDPSTQHGATAGLPGDEARRGPAVRRFDSGDLLTYSYLIYGARRKSVNAPPSLVSQIRLFRADKEVFTGAPMPVLVSQQSSNGGLVSEGSLRLGRELAPGNYFLQVVVTDSLAPADKRVSDQWIDFEIVK